MWFFRSPEIAYGEDALDYLQELTGCRALIVTDEHMVALGFVDMVRDALGKAGIDAVTFADVEPNPSLMTVRLGAQVALSAAPDWIVGLGGGSCLDAAKGIWVLYERPDLAPDAIAPMGKLGLRKKARMIAIPTTSGTGAETTWPIVLTDRALHVKLGLGNPENVPDIAIVDPRFTMQLPPQITADTGMDVLTHAIEGYTSQWRNDFSDGLCLKALQLVQTYLPRAYERGADDPEAREKMHTAASLAGLGFGNSMAAMAHAMGHSLGALFPIPHGRGVGLALPYTIEFTARGEAPTRYAGIARFMGFEAATEAEGAASLAQLVRDLAQRIDQPLSLCEAGLSRSDFETHLPQLVDNAFGDSTLALSLRFPSFDEFERVWRCAYEGEAVEL